MKTGLYSVAFTAAVGIGGLCLATEETGALLWWAGLVIVAAAFVGIAVLLFAKETPVQPGDNATNLIGNPNLEVRDRTLPDGLVTRSDDLDHLAALPNTQPDGSPWPLELDAADPFEYISQMEAGKCLAGRECHLVLDALGRLVDPDAITHEGWINVYRDRAGAIRFGWGFHASLADAQKSRNHSLSATLESRMKSTVIARLRVAFAEGDGLEGPQLAPAAGSRMDE